jgi:uncharacterized membrane-anchored protein YjiN (DUF445 family)
MATYQKAAKLCRDYVEKNGIENLINRLVNKAIQEAEPDPFVCILSTLQKELSEEKLEQLNLRRLGKFELEKEEGNGKNTPPNAVSVE